MRPAFYLRAERGETLDAVSAATGLKRQTIAAFERGDSTAHTKTLKALAGYYGVSVRALLEEPQVSTPPAA